MSATGTVDEVVVSAEVSTGWVVADPLHRRRRPSRR
jgi:hypothetical protein